MGHKSWRPALARASIAGGAVGAIVLGMAAPAMAAPGSNNGNAGDFFVKSSTATLQVPSNDPHPGCTFDLAFFNYAPSDSLAISIDAQPPSGTSQLTTGSFTVPVNAPSPVGGGQANPPYDGFTTFTVNTTGLKANSQQGYHLEADVTDVSTGLTKQKVFWVNCPPTPPPTPTSVTPAAVTFTQPTCAAAATYTVPNDTGVVYEYTTSGAPITAGTYTVNSYPTTVSITAVPASSSYTLTGTTVWSTTFTGPTGCGVVSGGQTLTPAIPVAPSYATGYCTTSGNAVAPTYTIPNTTGVIYSVGGLPVVAGTYTSTTYVTVTATPAAGYTLAPVSWVLPLVSATGCHSMSSVTTTKVTPPTATPPTAVSPTVVTSAVLPAAVTAVRPAAASTVPTQVLGESFTRTAPSTAAATTLPFTGASHVWAMVFGGLASLVAGAMLLLLGRRRSSAAASQAVAGFSEPATAGTRTPFWATRSARPGRHAQPGRFARFAAEFAELMPAILARARLAASYS